MLDSVISRFVSYLKVERNASPHTITSYKKDLDSFALFLAAYDAQGRENPDAITRFHIRAWMGKLSDDGLSRSSIARKVSCLKSFFKYTLARGYTTQNPAELVSIPRTEKKLPVNLQQDEALEMLTDFPVETDWDAQDKAILELLYATGIRLAELISIDVRDVQTGSHLLRLMGKGARERIVPYGEHAKAALDDWLSRRSRCADPEAPEEDRRALFLSKSGRRIYPVAVQRMVKKHIARVSEISKKSPHVLRHSFATHLLGQGADIRVIKELLGHAALTSTQIYTQTSIDHLKKVHEKAHPRGN
ncbi:integrase/recombinase XerC [Cyclonatronum proteinivorum]|uniref:Tyrosine recombinase XerC n=1 Tax=Cyclonatronum proteinivorum TaxID=1457365 RepID=A0A345UL43_9BACT|nr:tyrosine recombinase [Cyclonatronum proteinivorum]AXJ01195.1 integrase/recombinase XerC [Cyclonatronum proteinivorum]